MLFRSISKPVDCALDQQRWRLLHIPFRGHEHVNSPYKFHTALRYVHQKVICIIPPFEKTSGVNYVKLKRSELGFVYKVRGIEATLIIYRMAPLFFELQTSVSTVGDSILVDFHGCLERSILSNLKILKVK
jgi:hypothetical protein